MNTKIDKEFEDDIDRILGDFPHLRNIYCIERQSITISLRKALETQKEDLAMEVEGMKIITPDKKPELTEEEVDIYNQAIEDILKLLNK